MISDNTKIYLDKLREFAITLTDKLQQEVFIALCIRFKAQKDGKIMSKFVTRKELIERLISRGLMEYESDRYTGLQTRTPSPKPVNAAVKQLQKLGAPVIVLPRNEGYFIEEYTGANQLRFI